MKYITNQSRVTYFGCTARDREAPTITIYYRYISLSQREAGFNRFNALFLVVCGITIQCNDIKEMMQEAAPRVKRHCCFGISTFTRRSFFRQMNNIYILLYQIYICVESLDNIWEI